MQYSGYGVEERVKVYRLAKRKYDEMLRKDAGGEIPLYRGKNWNRSERLRAKELKKKTWFKGKRDVLDAVFFVKATPGSALAEKCKMEFKRSDLRINVVERTGRSVKSCLVKSNPFKKVGCSRESCVVCKLDGNVDC